MNKASVFAVIFTSSFNAAHSRLSLLFASFHRQDINTTFLFVQYIIAQVQTYSFYAVLMYEFVCGGFEDELKYVHTYLFIKAFL